MNAEQTLLQAIRDEIGHTESIPSSLVYRVYSMKDIQMSQTNDIAMQLTIARSLVGKKLTRITAYPKPSEESPDGSAIEVRLHFD